MFHQRHSVRKTVAIISAICIWLAAALQAFESFGLTPGRESPEWGRETRQKLRALDYDTLKIYWGWKRDQLGFDVMIDLLTSAGLFGLAYCVLILKKVFRRFKGGESDLPGFMTSCFFIGAILPSIQWLQTLGTTTTSDYISEWEQLPPEGLRALHIAYQISRGSGLYLFSSQFLFVSLGLILCGYLSIATSEIPKKHAIFGFVTAGFGIIAFILELVAFNTDTFVVSAIFGVSILIFAVVLLPSWTIWLGVELRRLKQDVNAMKRDNLDVALTENAN